MKRWLEMLFGRRESSADKRLEALESRAGGMLAPIKRALRGSIDAQRQTERIIESYERDDRERQK